MDNQFHQAIAAFDALNSQDPNQHIVDGKPIPFELFFAQQLTEWVLRLNPQASKTALLAARCQHLCRWKIPRSHYPQGRAGYLAWRRDLKRFHADQSEKVLQNLGYDPHTIQRVRSINLKKNRPHDPEVQLIQDALSLFFLQHQLHPLAAKTPPPKLQKILQKTWKKMSPQAQTIAHTLPPNTTQFLP